MQIYLKIKLLRVALEIFLQGSSYKDIFVETNKNNFHSKYICENCICENMHLRKFSQFSRILLSNILKDA